MKQRFGSTGEQLHRYARGIDPRPILPPLEKSSIVARYECEDGSIEEAMDGLRTLAETCAGELLRRRAAGRLVGLSLIWTDESTRLLPDRKPTGSLENGEPPALPAPKGQVMGTALRISNELCRFRIGSIPSGCRSRSRRRAPSSPPFSRGAGEGGRRWEQRRGSGDG